MSRASRAGLPFTTHSFRGLGVMAEPMAKNITLVYILAINFPKSAYADNRLIVTRSRPRCRHARAGMAGDSCRTTTMAAAHRIQTELMPGRSPAQCRAVRLAGQAKRQRRKPHRTGRISEERRVGKERVST